MTLQLPGEIVVEEVLPTLRVELARALDQRSFTQQEIADRLGVTQAAVSKYLRGDAPVESLIADDDRVTATVERIADGFADGEMDDYEALAELLALIEALEDRGPICELHEAAMPSLQGVGCDLCVRGPDERVETERAVLSNVRRAVRQFAALPAATAHVPNVGTNVGMALPDAEGVTDVAAVPGRLHAMRGRVNVPSNPEFGGSQHVATTILVARSFDASVRGALNLRTSDALLEAVREAGFDPAEFDAGYEDRRETLRSLFDRATEGGEAPKVIFNRGDFAVEPMTYVLGTSAVDAVERTAELLDRVERE
jgi:predicted fused transcriptional regulator/phosphomethylpyrimidine kinase/predicted transcriptional regulator